MRTKARLVPAVALLLLAFADRSLNTSSALAEEDCLAAPNAPATPGSHWYYRTDSVKQSKCWYMRAEGQAMQTPAAQQKTETSVAAKRPAAAMPKTAPHQAASEVKQVRPIHALADKLVQWGIQDGAQSSRQARADTVAWPDPPPPAGADTAARPGPPPPTGDGDVVWPDPPPSQTVRAPQRTLKNTAEERANQTPEEPATVGNPDESAVSYGELPAGLFLALAFGLVIAGMIVRRIVRLAFSGRRTVFFDRRTPVETSNVASDIPKFMAPHHDPAPKWVDDNCMNNEVKEALRKLLLVLDRNAA